MNKDFIQQLDFFDEFEDLFNPPNWLTEIPPQSCDISGQDSSMTQIESVLTNVDEYLKKGEVLETLAKEYFSNELKKVSLSEVEESLYSVAVDKEETLLSLVRKIAKKVTRPLLRSIQVPDDEFVKKLCDMVEFDVSIRITEKDEFSLNYVLSNSQQKGGPDTILEVTLMESGYKPLKILGAQNTPHTGSRKSGLYRSGIKAADLGEFFALLIVLSQIKVAFARIREMDEEQKKTDLLYNQFLAIEQDNRERFSQRTYKDTGCGFVGDGTLIGKELWMPVNFSGAPLPLMRSYILKKQLSYKDFSNYGTCLKAWKTQYSQLEKEQALDSMPVVLDFSRSQDLFATCFMEILDIHYHDFLPRCATSAIEDYWPYLSTSLDKAWYHVQDSIYGLITRLFYVLHETKSQQAKSLKYYRELSSDYARSYQQKKNIPKKTLQAMQDSVFNRYFGYVEFDETCDLEKLKIITDEFIAVKETYLSFVDSSKNALRFRRLGHHKAAGLYYPHMKCLCVDVANPYSMLHEYGHLIDYEYGKLSLEYDFLNVRSLYKERMNALMSNPGNVSAQLKGKTKYNLSYYLEPTEIFARSFELYMAKEKGICNSILPKEFSFAYPQDTEFLLAVKDYFDQLLSSLNCKNSSCHTDIRCVAGH